MDNDNYVYNVSGSKLKRIFSTNLPLTMFLNSGSMLHGDPILTCLNPAEIKIIINLLLASSNPVTRSATSNRHAEGNLIL